MAIFVDSRAVAGMLEVSPEHFQRTRPELEDRHEFPEPMPHCRRPLKWRRSQVQAWIERNGMPRATPIEPDAGNVVRMMRKAMAQ